MNDKKRIIDLLICELENQVTSFVSSELTELGLEDKIEKTSNRISSSFSFSPPKWLLSKTKKRVGDLLIDEGIRVLFPLFNHFLDVNREDIAALVKRETISSNDELFLKFVMLKQCALKISQSVINRVNESLTDSTKFNTEQITNQISSILDTFILKIKEKIISIVKEIVKEEEVNHQKSLQDHTISALNKTPLENFTTLVVQSKEEILNRLELLSHSLDRKNNYLEKNHQINPIRQQEEYDQKNRIKELSALNWKLTMTIVAFSLLTIITCFVFIIRRRKKKKLDD